MELREFPVWSWWALIIVLVLLIRRLFRKEKSLKGLNVLVTGAGTGIGKLMSINFAKEGANLILLDIRESLLKETEEELRKIPQSKKQKSYVCDVSNREMVYEVAKKVKQEFPKVDILVNNAGIVSGKPFLELKDEAMIRTMEVNTFAHFWMLKAFLPQMVQDNEGHIVTIASLMGLSASACLSDYCASKFAAVGFHESIRLELKRLKCYGVKTTLVCPYGINTGMFDGMQPKFQWLVPLLDQHYVAQEVVKAVKREQLFLGLPEIVNWMGPLGRLLPVPVYDAMLVLFGGTEALNNLKGRGAEWSMHKLDAKKTQ